MRISSGTPLCIIRRRKYIVHLGMVIEHSSFYYTHMHVMWRGMLDDTDKSAAFQANETRFVRVAAGCCSLPFSLRLFRTSFIVLSAALRASLRIRDLSRCFSMRLARIRDLV